MIYSSYEGRLKFKNKEDLAEALKIMDPWFDKKYLDDERLFANLELEFPEMFQAGDVGRNIHRGIDILLQSLPTRGTLVGTSTDGCLDGWVIKDGRQVKSDDLMEWIKKKNLKTYNQIKEYEKDDSTFDQYCELTNDVCQMYYDEYL